MDNEETQNVGNEEQVETTATETPNAENGSDTQGEEVPNAPKTFTQEQVNEIVRERLKKANDGICKKYGTKNEEELDELVGKSKSYDELKEKYDGLESELKAYKEQFTLSKNNVLEDKQDDVRTYFKGKGLELNEENLKEALGTHPEWQPQQAKSTTIVPMGAEKTQSKRESDEDAALRLFGFDKFVR